MKNTSQIHALQFRKAAKDMEGLLDAVASLTLPMRFWAKCLIKEHSQKLKAAVLATPTQLVSNLKDAYLF